MHIMTSKHGVYSLVPYSQYTSRDWHFSSKFTPNHLFWAPPVPIHIATDYQSFKYIHSVWYNI